MKLVCVLFIIVSLNFDFVLLVNPQCSYEYQYWHVVGEINQCRVQNNLNIISSESAVITEATGSHYRSSNNDDVLGFHVENKKIEIFPRGLEKIYKNLKLIIITYGRIKEIHQSDFKPFSQLEYLNLYENDIEVLEEGLFDFNPKLGLISFSSNKISQIHPNVFDHLTKLTYLWFKGNQCTNKYADEDSAEKVKNLIKQVKLQCTSLLAYKEVQKLKLNFNYQNLQFTEKLTKVENTCQNSFLELSPKILSFEATSKNLLTRVENTAASLSASNSKNAQELQALNSKMSEMELATNSSNEAIEVNQAKIDKLEKTFADDLQTLKSEMVAEIQKIMKKLVENAENFEKKVDQKIVELSTKLMESQTQELSTVNQKFNNIEGKLLILQNESKNCRDNSYDYYDSVKKLS